MLDTIITIVQVVTAVLLIVLLAVQTDKAEQGGGGVMGLGASGGRTTGNVNVAVGAERVLKPLTAWTAMGFLAVSLLNAIPRVNFVHVLIVGAVYLLLMSFGNTLWRAFIAALGR